MHAGHAGHDFTEPIERAGGPCARRVERGKRPERAFASARRGRVRRRRRRGVALDIIYVPTPQKVVEKMLEVAHVTRTDVVYDLGCGDGRIVVTAARKMGAHGIGFPDAADGVSGKTNRHLPGYVPPYASRE